MEICAQHRKFRNSKINVKNTKMHDRNDKNIEKVDKI